MKLIAMLLLLIIPIQWEPDFENAKKTAKEKHELILLNFSGSDWCGPCIAMRKEYFESEVFTQIAKDHLILVNADFPRKKKNQLPAAIIKRNEALAEIYNKSGNFPFTVLLDANGKVLKTWNGKPDAAVAKWTAEVKTLCDANKQ
jgi:thiol-disulfide isomerase/thioredoxin